MSEVQKAGMFTELKEFYKGMFDFKGRARRREYWVSYIWNIATMVLLTAIFCVGFFSCIDFESGDFDFNIIGGGITILSGIAIVIFTIVFEIATIAISIRRCHDIGKSGWYLLWCCLGCLCCGIGGIAWIIICCLDSQEEANQWGENPKSEALNQYDNSKGIVASIVACVLAYVIFFVLMIVASVMAVL